ncbi:mannose-1-phosphate guanylyltransferase [Anseongella ginsenosidimutans]|nr:mannose-1-phosphate guanylyltransferase [Anseongella ginsenosidimutans]QEC54285.1 mannose-1-phosphate guanylyltransferase [Anseongella ginsenosidimutans]
MNKNFYAVIMAGGIGSRFWPVSRQNRPKQFIDILGAGKTLIQLTYERFSKICPPENIYIVTNESYRDTVREQLPDIQDEQVLCEPIMRNTAPCIAFACYKIARLNPDAVTVIAPSDHLILKEDLFGDSIEKAMTTALGQNVLLTLGIVPSRPDTGYGYVQYTEKKLNEHFHKVKTFTEKPNLELAQTFIRSGDFLWNAGIFIWNVKALKGAFERFLPEMHEIFQEGAPYFNTKKEADFIRTAYAQCTNISIDYAIMERADNVYVMPGNFGWSDLGTWGSLHSVKEKDERSNAINGKQVMTYETSDCMVHVPENKLVILQGMENFIVVDTGDVLMICKKSAEQQIKQIAGDVRQKEGDKFS